MDINQLGFEQTASGSDSLLIWDSVNGRTTRISIASLMTYINNNLLVPKGLEQISSLYALRGAASVVPLTTVLAKINPFASNQVISPSGSLAFAVDMVNGLLVASRDVAIASVNVALNGTWANAVDLTLAVQVGPDALPYTLVPKSISTGNGNMKSVHFSGYLFNPNNINGILAAGDKIKLCASFGTAGNLTVSGVEVTVQSLDGV